MNEPSEVSEEAIVALVGRTLETFRVLERMRVGDGVGARLSYTGLEGSRWVVEAEHIVTTSTWVCSIEGRGISWTAREPLFWDAFHRVTENMVTRLRGRREVVTVGERRDGPPHSILEDILKPERSFREDEALALASKLAAEFKRMLEPPVGQETCQTRIVADTEYRVRLTTYDNKSAMATVLDKHNGRLGLGSGGHGALLDCIAYATEEAIRMAVMAAVESAKVDPQSEPEPKPEAPSEPSTHDGGWHFL